MNLQWETAEEITLQLSKRVRTIRKRKKLTQYSLSLKSGVSLGSIKRFENTGMISLLSLTKLAIALGCTDEIKELFTNIPYLNIQEVIREQD